ncbi:HNH endonuclease signature motif containing protein [Carboxylicivirga linearis]|uniref:HNH endonuclease n=1 Tax=Carboxylicivirga linearis TaxID=1628157 RepID=A0ABS5K080_9BACT|nr:HNH endonuclease signature motif containing protein [Carboxylicivirga linearis]MBS2100548.1 HNH endonuclease [Carboxylicivirga linearis]
MSWTQEQIDAVWEKGTIVPPNKPSEWRKDMAGAWIHYSQFGNTDSQYGWEIDHMKPEALKGSNHIDNLQPLQWQNNRTKGDNYPKSTTSITAKGVDNIEKIQTWFA